MVLLSLGTVESHAPSAVSRRNFRLDNHGGASSICDDSTGNFAGKLLGGAQPPSERASSGCGLYLFTLSTEGEPGRSLVSTMRKTHDPLLEKWRRFRKRPRDESALILCAIGLLPITKITLRLLSFHRCNVHIDTHTVQH